MNKELKEKALQFIWDEGYGKGTDLTLNSVAYLMTEFTQRQIKLSTIPNNRDKTVFYTEDWGEELCELNEIINLNMGDRFVAKNGNLYEVCFKLFNPKIMTMVYHGKLIAENLVSNG